MTATQPADSKTPATTLLADSQAHLRGLLLMPTEDEAKQAAKDNKQTFESVDVIAANELAITKRVSSLIKWLTGVGVPASLAGAASGLWADLGDTVTAAFVIAAAVILAAGLLGLARVMDGDVRGRAASTVAQLEARARVAEALVNGSGPGRATPKADPAPSNESAGALHPTEQQILAALAAYHEVTVTTDEGTHPVIGTKWGQSQGLELLLLGGDRIKPDRVTAFTAQN